VAGTLPNVELKLRIIQNNIANIYWSWKLDGKGNPPAGKRVPVDVPNEFINTNKPEQGLNLSSFFNITLNPLQITVKYRSQASPSNVFSIDAFVYDQYLNWIAGTAYSEGGQNF